MRFTNRTEAGRVLAGYLTKYKEIPDGLVLGLPRGGVPVAFQVAQALRLPLDVFVVRKLGVPGRPELAMGAIATGPVRIRNDDVISTLGITEAVLDAVTEEETRELERREQLYRGVHSPPEVVARKVILVDDGIATGATMRSAIGAIKAQHPAKLVVAVPTIARETFAELQAQVDELVAVLIPANFYSVGQWYENFDQTSDEQVAELLRRH